MAADFRSDPMDSPEGKGLAKRAWEKYVAAVNKSITPAVMPLIRPGVQAVARQQVVDLVGFWLMWHLHGGFEGLEQYGLHRSTIYRKVSKFRQAFGEHPDVYEFPGVTIDYDAYWKAAAEKYGPRPT